LPQASKTWSNPIVLKLCEAMGIADPEEAILICAKELVNEVGLRRPYQRLEMLASWREIIRIDRIPIPDAGRLLPTVEGLVIEVNSRNSPGRQNFSICHEISHTFFPTYRLDPVARHDPDTGYYTQTEQEEEYLCDVAASELLMPTEEFERELRFQRLHVYSIPILAKEFGASLEAAARRCLRAEPSLGAVLVWEPRYSATGAGSDLTLKWSSSNLGAGLDEITRRQIASSDSLVQRAYEKDGTYSGDQVLQTRTGPVVVQVEALGFTHLVADTRRRKVLAIVLG